MVHLLDPEQTAQFEIVVPHEIHAEAPAAEYDPDAHALQADAAVAPVKS